MKTMRIDNREAAERRGMLLQLFAESGEGGQGEGDQGNQGERNGNSDRGQEGQDRGRTFTQADLDKLAAKVRAEERKKMESEIAKARSEGERLARMTEEEKARHAAEEREAALTKREKELSMRELRATARDILGEKSLPADLLETLDYTSAETVKSSIDSMEGAFRKAVQQGVEERMRGKTPDKRQGGAGETIDAELRRAFGLAAAKKTE